MIYDLITHRAPIGLYKYCLHLGITKHLAQSAAIALIWSVRRSVHMKMRPLVTTYFQAIADYQLLKLSMDGGKFTHAHYGLLNFLTCVDQHCLLSFSK